MSVKNLLSNKTSAVTGDFEILGNDGATFQAVGKTSSGSGSATIDIEGSIDKTNAVLLGTITLSLSTSDSTDGFYVSSNWPFVRAKLRSISGTGSVINVFSRG